MIRTHQFCLLATMLAGAVVQASASSIIADGGFESGTPGSYMGDMGDGWVVTAGTGAICNDITHAGCGNVGPAHTGDQMAFLDWSNTLNTTTQTLTTVIGQDYTISYWVLDTHANFLDVTFGGATLFDGTAPTTGDYVQYVFDATATSTSTVLAFSGQRNVGGGTLLDDVSVTPVSVVATPEPSTLLLTGFCFVAVGLRRAARKRAKKQHSAARLGDHRLRLAHACFPQHGSGPDQGLSPNGSDHPGCSRRL